MCATVDNRCLEYLGCITSHHSRLTGFQIGTFWHSAVSRIFYENFAYCLVMRVIAVDLVLHSFARHDLLIGARACVLHLIANLRAPNRQRRTKRWFLLLHVVVVVVLPTPLAWNGFRMIFLRIRQMWFYIVPSFLISKIWFQKKYSHNLSVKSRNETTNSPIHQVTNLKCSIKAREPFKTPF